MTGIAPNELWPAASDANRGFGVFVRKGESPDLHLERYTSFVDVIDFATGRVMAHASFDREVLAIMPGGFAYSMGKTNDGVQSIVIWRMALTGTSPGK